MISGTLYGSIISQSKTDSLLAKGRKEKVGVPVERLELGDSQRWDIQLSSLVESIKYFKQV